MDLADRKSGRGPRESARRKNQSGIGGLSLESTVKTAEDLPRCDSAEDDMRQPAGGGLRFGISPRQIRSCLRTKTVVLGAVFAACLQLSSTVAADPTVEPSYSTPVQRVARILEQIKARYARPIDDQKLIAGALSGVLKGLDPHSAYLDEEAFRELQRDAHGEYGGLGIESRMQPGFMEVTSVLESTPAYRAGLRPGDRITRIGDTSVAGMSLEQVIAKVRGEPGTRVSLAVVRDGQPDLKVFTLTRETIQGRSVESSVIEPGYAYLRLTQFQSHTGEMMAKGVKRLLEEREGRIAGIVLDLRDNPGGMLSSAVGVAAAFLPPNAPVVGTEGTGSDSNMRLYARTTDYLGDDDADYLEGLPAAVKTLPVVVLVNGESASAAEIVAGALQDNKRATIVGTKTFGKGSIQTVIPFGDGTGMELTTAYYYTPSGRRIQGQGVIPDIVVEPQPIAQREGVAALHAVAVERQSPEPRAATATAACASRNDNEDAASRADGSVTQPPQIGLSGGDCQLERALRLLRSQTSISQR
jgi:carboxyl-terminal processing protease